MCECRELTITYYDPECHSHSNPQDKYLVSGIEDITWTGSIEAACNFIYSELRSIDSP